MRTFLYVLGHLMAIFFTVGTLLFAFAAVSVAGLQGWALVLAAAAAAVTLHFRSTRSGIARGSVAFLIVSVGCFRILGFTGNFGELEVGLVTTASLWCAALVTKRYDRARSRRAVSGTAGDA